MVSLQTVFYILLFAVMTALLWFLPKKKQTKRVGIGIMLVSLVLELFVFNYHSYHLWFRGYPGQEAELTREVVSGNAQLQSDGAWLITDKATIELHGIDIPVGTVAFDLNWQTAAEYPANYVDAVFDFMDDTQTAYYRSNVADGRMVNGQIASQTIPVALSGNVRSMRVDLTLEEGRSVLLQNIRFNSAVPMQLSILRLLLTTLLPLALYAMLSFPSFTDPAEKRRLFMTRVTACITAVLVLTAFLVTAMLHFDSRVPYGDRFESLSGNQITKELVDAFSQGQAELLTTPSDELLALENPYDWSQRYTTKVSALWDHLLYEGKYYSYYGIAPVLLLFLPYYQLTGFYFPTAEAVFLFGAIGIICLSALFLELVKRFFPKIPVNIALFSLAVLQFSSGVWYCFVYDNFYEIAQACGFMFTCAGMWLLLRSGVVGEGKLRRPSLVLSSFCLSMAVLSRPTLALYCIVAVIFLAFGLVKLLKTTPKKNHRKQVIGYLACAFTCYVVIGGIQMVYNYVRFGNILDFGIQYSLTINDFTRAQYHLDFALIGFWNFLFAFPKVEPVFPFVFSNFSDLSVNGYYFEANNNAIGLIWRALPMFGYLGAAGAWKKLAKPHRLPALLLIGSCCVAAPLIIIFSIWESGYGVRYCADFAWQLVTGALCILYFRYQTQLDDPLRADRRQMTVRFFAVSAVLALVINFALIYSYIPWDKMLVSGHYALERTFAFWQ